MPLRGGRVKLRIIRKFSDAASARVSSLSRKTSPRVPSRYRAFSIKIHGIIMRRSIVNTGRIPPIPLALRPSRPSPRRGRSKSDVLAFKVDRSCDRAAVINAPLLPFRRERTVFRPSERDQIARKYNRDGERGKKERKRP